MTCTRQTMGWHCQVLATECTITLLAAGSQLQLCTILCCGIQSSERSLGEVAGQTGLSLFEHLCTGHSRFQPTQFGGQAGCEVE